MRLAVAVFTWIGSENLSFNKEGMGLGCGLQSQLLVDGTQWGTWRWCCRVGACPVQVKGQGGGTGWANVMHLNRERCMSKEGEDPDRRALHALRARVMAAGMECFMGGGKGADLRQVFLRAGCDGVGNGTDGCGVLGLQPADY
jgi:hypothetical protein